MADSEHDGRLTRDDFAVAMHLIRQKLAGKDLPSAPMAPAASPVRLSPSPSPSPSPQPEPTPAPSRRNSRPTPPQRSSTGSRADAHPDPTTVRLPDDLDDDLRSDTPPPPYELIASDAT